jgi:DNA-directed RNA polymerase specialized sigma24 family protein
VQTNAETIEDGVPTYLSVDEVRGIIRQLSPADATRIIQAARWFSARCGIPAEDLHQEAFTRLLSGDRHARRSVGFAREVGGIIKSLASSERDAIRSGLREVRPPPDGVSAPELVDPSPSPEALVLSACDDGSMLAAIGRLIEDDEQLQLLVEGMCDRMRGEELEDLLGVDARGLASARRKLKRRLQAAFPKGMGL